MALTLAPLIEDTAPGQHKAQCVTCMKRQRNAGKMVGKASIPGFRYAPSGLPTHYDCHRIGA